MKNLKLFVLLFAIAGMMQSCVSNKAFQTARTTPAGDSGWGIGLALPSGEIIDTTSLVADTVTLGGFAGEFFYRYGITDKLDAGVNVTLIGTGGADLKYQFLGDSESPLAASIGAGFGYLSIGGSTDGDSSYKVIDITIPAYVSYHPNDALGLYLSPRYILRKFGDQSTNYLGGIAGIRLGGERSGMFLEYGYLNSSDANFGKQTQLNVGFGIGIR